MLIKRGLISKVLKLFLSLSLWLCFKIAYMFVLYVNLCTHLSISIYLSVVVHRRLMRTTIFSEHRKIIYSN